MKRLIASIAVLLGCAAAVWAVPSAPLTTLHAVHALSNAEADQGLPVDFEATVTYYQQEITTLFVQDGGEGLYIIPSTNVVLLPGDRILVRGKTQGSFRPIVASTSITLLHHGTMAKALPATYDELIHARRDSLLVTVRGTIRTADVRAQSHVNSADLLLLTPDGYVHAVVDHISAAQLKKLLDAEVDLTGVAGGEFDGKMQMRGAQLNISSPAFIHVLHTADTSPWLLPITPMDRIIAGYHVTDRTERIRVHGSITYYLPGSAAVLQNGTKSLWIETQTSDPMQIGDIADAVGFPDVHNGFLALARAEVMDTHARAPVTPLATAQKKLTASLHIIDLVSVEGQVVTTSHGGSQDEYDLAADGQIFSAIYRHPPNGTALPMKQIPPGSMVRVTGICITEDSNPFNHEVPFDILLRNFDDITVIARPSLVNTRNLILAVIVLLLVVIAAGGWGWVLMKKVHLQTVAMAARTEAEAAMERRRTSILIDINGSRPLIDIMKQIVEMVSSGLNGAPCWCVLADGATIGDRSFQERMPRLIQIKIAGRSGASLGTLYAGLDPLLSENESDSEALSAGARLATLAIETRRLYSDLRRRSEYDLLTDIPNRFAMDKRLTQLIEEARQNKSVFGLIYIDLDGFKPINDRYGHHIGDLYLQEVAIRMTRQLRDGDMLARLGGDEFAALVSVANSLADVEEAAHRLERCFDEPFMVEEFALHGAASYGIALYPIDGGSKDSLLSAADAAMYVVKHRKKQLESSVA
jgi:diguanylate cyclase (GGDEF)-like protein